MKLLRKCILVFSFFVVFHGGELHAKEEKLKPHDKEIIAVHTYGGGELLKKVFNAISLLIYGNSKTGLGKTFYGIIHLSLAIGGLAAIMMAFSRGSFLPFIQGWFLPALGICGILLIPRSTLYIEDHLVAKSRDTKSAVISKVEDVPFFLAQFSSLTSWLSYKFTQALEDVTHGTNDSIYNWTGHIYAGESLFQSGKIQLSHPILEQNIKNFCYHCIFNDLNINPPSYTRDELAHTSDILSFLDEKTTPWLSFPYQKENGEVSQFTCAEGISDIHKQLNNASPIKSLSLLDKQFPSLSDLTKPIILGEIGSAASLLLKASKYGQDTQKKLMTQQYLIDKIKTSTNPTYAQRRAEHNYQETQKTLGAMSATSIVSLRIFFEAVVYMTFPLVLIFALVCLGFKPLVTWAQFLLWINIWPPFFVVVNFMLNSIWNYRIEKAFGTNDLALTIFTSEGLGELYSSMEAIAAGALFSVPFLAFAIVKGGVQSMVHLAGTLNAPAQSAASQAVFEQTSGNFSIGNTSIGNRSVDNRSAGLWNERWGLSQGGGNVQSGNETTSFDDSGALVIEQKKHQLRNVDLMGQEAVGNTLQTQVSQSQSHLNEISANSSQSISSTATEGESLYRSLSNDHSFSHLKNHTDQESASNLWTETDQQIKDYGKTYGLNEQSAINESVKIGLGNFGIGVGGNFDNTNSHLTQEQAAERQNQAMQITENLQKLSQYSTTDTTSESMTDTQRAAHDFNHSYAKSEQFAHQMREAYSESEAWQTLQSQYKNNSTSLNQSLNDQFITHLNDECGGDVGRMMNILNDPKTSAEKAQGFLDKWVTKEDPFAQIDNTISLLPSNNMVEVSKRVAGRPDIEQESSTLQAKFNENQINPTSLEGIEKIEIKGRELRDQFPKEQDIDKIKNTNSWDLAKKTATGKALGFLKSSKDHQIRELEKHGFSQEEIIEHIDRTAFEDLP